LSDAVFSMGGEAAHLEADTVSRMPVIRGERDTPVGTIEHSTKQRTFVQLHDLRERFAEAKRPILDKTGCPSDSFFFFFFF